MLNSGFFLLLSFYKSFFLFAIFSYKFICIWIWAGVRKGADSGFTIGNRESIYNWGWLEWCKGSPWTSLSVKDCFPPRMERKGQSVYVYLIAGWSWHWVGLAQGRWRHAARVVARINSVKDSTTPDDKRWGGRCRWSSWGKIPGCQSHDMESGQYGSQDRRWKEARSWRLDF